MSPVLWSAPFLLQGGLMAIDEGWFHRRRGLPLWERVGHPMDTLTVAACFAWVVLRRPDAPGALVGYGILASFSCLFVTKDEIVHKALCSAAESWLHALLFVLHPIVFLAAGALWRSGVETVLTVQLVIVLSFAAYQAIYWGPWNRRITRSAA